MRYLSVAVIAMSMLVVGTVSAEPRSSITRTGSHTKIVIHDTSPRAVETRNELARRARDRQDLREQRAHELELARIRSGQSSSANPRRSADRRRPTEKRRVSSSVLPSIQDRQRAQKEANKPSAFMNGGQWTGLYWGGFGGWGFPGFVGPGFVGPGYGPGRPCRPALYRGRAGYRGGYRGGGHRGASRGRGCR